MFYSYTLHNYNVCLTARSVYFSQSNIEEIDSKIWNGMKNMWLFLERSSLYEIDLVRWCAPANMGTGLRWIPNRVTTLQIHSKILFLPIWLREIIFTWLPRFGLLRFWWRCVYLKSAIYNVCLLMFTFWMENWISLSMRKRGFSDEMME